MLVEMLCDDDGGGTGPAYWMYHLYAAVQPVDARLEALDNLPNATHFIEFYLELVDFAKYGAEAGDFSVGHLHGVACAVVLHLGCCLCLLGELADGQYDRLWCGL